MIEKLIITTLLGFRLISANAQSSISISGVVQLADGSPVKNAVVDFYPYGAFSGLQSKVFTDVEGAFTLHTQYLGQGLISANKASEGYPDAALAFYRLSDYKSVREISVRREPIKGIILIFSTPSPRLELMIEPQDGSEISTAQITVKSLDRPNVYSTSSWNIAEKWNLVLPKSPVVISVEAPGYERWTFTTGQTGVPESLVLPLVATLKRKAAKAESANH